jgi:hypothetical protein
VADIKPTAHTMRQQASISGISGLRCLLFCASWILTWRQQFRSSIRHCSPLQNGTPLSASRYRVRERFDPPTPFSPSPFTMPLTILTTPSPNPRTCSQPSLSFSFSYFPQITSSPAPPSSPCSCCPRYPRSRRPRPRSAAPARLLSRRTRSLCHLLLFGKGNVVRLGGGSLGVGQGEKGVYGEAEGGKEWG